MDKNTARNFLFIILAILMIFPFIINSLMFFNLLPVKGSIDTWIPTLGTFWGAIIGGVISGVLTLFGVQLTIKSSFDAIKQQKLEQIKNEEEVRYINQLPALIKIKFELSKMLESLESAEKSRVDLKLFLKDKRETPREVEDEINETNYKMYLINESNWTDIGLIQDVDFQSSLIEIKHLYQEVSETLSYNIDKIKVKIEQLEEAVLFENHGYVNTPGLMELREYELKLDEILINKKKAWEDIKEKNLKKVLDDHISILIILMDSLQEFLNKRQEIRDGS